MNSINRILVLVILIGMVACSASKLIIPTEIDVDEGSVEYADLTLSQLENGKELYSTNCGKCHRHKRVSKYSKEEWEEIMPKMVRKANKKGSNLGATDQTALLRYAVTMGREKN